MIRVVVGGLLGGALGGLTMMFLYELPWVHRILFDPQRQSDLFMAVAPNRDMALSFAGLLGIGVFHAWLFGVLADSIPGSTWVAKGLFWGFSVWVLFWAFNEWFTFHAVLDQPLALILLELPLLLAGACVEGLTISFLQRSVVAKRRS